MFQDIQKFLIDKNAIVCVKEKKVEQNELY